MKTNKEIAASVFEKSRIVLEKRAVRRRRIAAVSATAGAAVIVTVTALMGKGAFLHGGIPTSEPVTVPSIAESRTDNTTDFDTSFMTSDSSAAETASSVSGDTSDNKSSKSVSSKQESSQSKASESRSSKTTSSEKTDRIISSSKQPSADNKTHDTTTSRESDNNTKTSSGINSEKTSSKKTSPKNTSSKNMSSKITSSFDKSRIESKPESKASSHVSSRPKDTDTPLIDSDTPNMPVEYSSDSEQYPNAVDTDVDQADSPVEDDYCITYYYGFDVDADDSSDIFQYADLVVKATVNNISFEHEDRISDSLSRDIDIPNENCGKLYTIAHLNVTEVLKGSYECRSLDLFMFGGMSDIAYRNMQKDILGSGKYIPLVEGRPDPAEGREYVFVLNYDDECGLYTLRDYKNSILSAE